MQNLNKLHRKGLAGQWSRLSVGSAGCRLHPATSDALKANRMALYGPGAETYAIGRTLGALSLASVKQYASF